MARGSQLEASALEARDHAARNGNRDRERTLRARRRAARRDQAAESRKVGGKSSTDFADFHRFFFLTCRRLAGLVLIHFWLSASVQSRNAVGS